MPFSPSNKEQFFHECIEKIIRPNKKYLDYFNGLQCSEADFYRIEVLLFSGFPKDGQSIEWTFLKEVEMRRRTRVISWWPLRFEQWIN